MSSACTAANPDFDASGGAEGSSGAPTSTGTEPFSTSASSEGESEVGNDTSDDGITTSTTESGDSNSDEESTGTAVCELEELPMLDVTVEHNGAAMPVCGTLVVEGVVEEGEDGYSWSVANCGCGVFGCPATYSIAIAAPESLLPAFPACARVEIIGVATEDGCEFSSLRIHPSNASLDPAMDAPVYLAAHGHFYADPPAQPPVHPGVFVGQRLKSGCPCPGDGCCLIEPGRYELEFYPPDGDIVGLAQGEQLTGLDAIELASLPGSLWEVAALSAHADLECDMRPHFDWIIRQRGG